MRAFHNFEHDSQISADLRSQRHPQREPAPILVPCCIRKALSTNRHGKPPNPTSTSCILHVLKRLCKIKKKPKPLIVAISLKMTSCITGTQSSPITSALAEKGTFKKRANWVEIINIWLLTSFSFLLLFHGRAVSTGLGEETHPMPAASPSGAGAALAYASLCQPQNHPNAPWRREPLQTRLSEPCRRSNYPFLLLFSRKISCWFRTVVGSLLDVVATSQ